MRILHANTKCHPHRGTEDTEVNAKGVRLLLWGGTDVSMKLEFLSNFESGPNKIKELLNTRIYYTVNRKQYGSTVSLKM